MQATAWWSWSDSNGDRFVPVIDWKLAGHDGGAAIVPIIDDLQQVARLIVCQCGEPPVIEDQEFDACDSLEQPGMAGGVPMG